MVGIRALLLVALAASVAVAQPKTAKEQASELVKKAIAKSDAGDHQGAIDLYLEAYKLAPLHTLLSNVGTEYQKAGKPFDALRYFCMYLEKDPAGVNVTYATAKAKALQIELGNKDVTDQDVCKPKAPAKPTGTTTATTTTTEVKETAPAPTPKAKDPGRTMKLAGIGVGVAGVAMAGLGVYFGIQAQAATDLVNDHKQGDPWPDDIVEREARGQRDENLQIAFLVAGGAAVVAGGALYYVGYSKKPAERAVAVVPTATHSSAGIALTGRF
jgi:hypothetical protein